MSRLTFDALRVASSSRRARWHGPDTEPWTGADWSNAMCGEAGEAANIVKKLRRLETGIGADHDGVRASLIEALGHELADTIAYVELLAQHYGIDLPDAVAAKFNLVSEREGFPERLPRRAEQSNPNGRPEVNCLDHLPHEGHNWSSLTHSWWCDGIPEPAEVSA